jgi:hypothetical protein
MKESRWGWERGRWRDGDGDEMAMAMGWGKRRICDIMEGISVV